MWCVWSGKKLFKRKKELGWEKGKKFKIVTILMCLLVY